ncbi:TetR/AcrR family transcriptional regulator [Subtercola sp. YIM 133946]|uniref:TetR/AcrR family transcriptional regulator n=1 Tax=Subtercola sp. YIM 133946 TaxID=3118909 RepID=UPI002F928416
MTEVGRVRAERVEVRRSRDLILDAAEHHYTDHQADPTMSELAQLAGVGSATLYRRFPSISDVIEALYERHFSYHQAIVDAMLAQPTGWDGVVTLITGIAAMVLEHPAVPRVTRKMLELFPDLRHGSRWDGPLRDVTARAHAEGALRPDVDTNDLTLAAFRLGEYNYLPEAARARIVARQAAIVLDGVRAGADRTELPGAAISTEELQSYLHTPMR